MGAKLFKILVSFVTIFFATIIYQTQGQSSSQTVVYQNLEFEYPSVQLPFDSANTYCHERNKTLVSVDSAAKDRILVDLFLRGQGNVTVRGAQHWIAAREVREGVWLNSNDERNLTPLYYTRWFPDQPDDINDLDCAFIHGFNLFYWRDANCSASFYFICETILY